MGISTHILDVARGKPAEGIAVALQKQRGDDDWLPVGNGVTNADGRVASLLPAQVPLEAGTYRISFKVQEYVDRHHGKGFYPRVEIAFAVGNPSEHFHVPLLLSPFGYSTYRGS